MNSISKRTLFLTLLALFLTRGNFSRASSLKIQDFQMYKKTEQGDATLFYQYIFRPSPISTSTFFTPTYEPFSLVENMAQQKIHDEAARRSIKKAWSQICAFARNSAQFYLMGELEAAPLSKIMIMSAPLLKTNMLSPQLSAGSDYIKPGIAVNNILNTNIHTHISYQVQEETMEAKLSKKFSEVVELELTHTHVFTDDHFKRVLLELSYSF